MKKLVLELVLLVMFGLICMAWVAAAYYLMTLVL